MFHEKIILYKSTVKQTRDISYIYLNSLETAHLQVICKHTYIIYRQIIQVVSATLQVGLKMITSNALCLVFSFSLHGQLDFNVLSTVQGFLRAHHNGQDAIG